MDNTSAYDLTLAAARVNDLLYWLRLYIDDGPQLSPDVRASLDAAYAPLLRAGTCLMRARDLANGRAQDSDK